MNNINCNNKKFKFNNKLKENNNNKEIENINKNNKCNILD